MSTLTKIVHRWGLLKGLQFYYRIKSNPAPIWQLPELKHPVHLRPSTSDASIFKQIFGMGEYDVDFDPAPATIIDGGGNIGLFAILMANRYPNARIISIEPDPENFAQLTKNAGYYPNITPVQAGIWNKPCQLAIVDEGFDEWGLQVKPMPEGEQGGITAVTIEEMMTKYNLTSLDVVKLDVEGAEAPIFQDNYHAWLSKTKVLIIELHDRNWPGISANFHKAIAQYPFTSVKHGEYYIYTRK